MADDSPPTPDRRDAGTFSSWVARLTEARRTGQDVDVPCGECTACCTSSQFVLIEPDETETLARIPRSLLVPAPGLPRGHVVLGYDEHGRCPMLVEGRCSIYGHRPRTCRAFDCRVLPAAGLATHEAAKVDLDRQARRWRFAYADAADRTRHEAVQAAAAFLRDRADQLRPAPVPTHATQLAALAVAVHEAFLGVGQAGEATVVEPTPETVRAALPRPGTAGSPPPGPGRRPRPRRGRRAPTSDRGPRP